MNFGLDRRAALMAAAALLLGAASLPAPAAEIAMSPALKKVIDGAKKEGTLNLQYGSDILGGPEGAQVAAAGIKKMFGVSLNLRFTPGPSFAPMASRLYTEMQAGQNASTDVYNGTAVQIDPYLARGLWRKIPWTKLYPGRITPTISEADGRALRVVTALPGILYNKKVGADFGKVTKMAELLKPQYKGRLYTEPYLAGFDVLVSNKLWGYARTASFIGKLSKQVGGLIRCGALDQIASGAAPALALSCGSLNPKYKNIIANHIIHDAAMRRFNYICIPKNAAHPDAAILFGLFISSPEGQKNVQLALYGADLDTYPETATHAETAALEKEGVKFTDVTLAWWGEQKNIKTNLRNLIRIIARR